MYLLTWGIAALTLVPAATHLFGDPGVSNPLFYVAVYVPSVVGFILTARFEGRDGVRRLVRRLDPRRVHPLWLVGILVGFPLVFYLTAKARGLPAGFVAVGQAAAIWSVAIFLDPGPIGEEIGWRGFALPRLLERFSPLVASLILGTVWGLWHLPVLIDPHYPQYGFGIAAFVAGTVAMSFFMTRAHLWTGGSLLVAILLHFVVNEGGVVVGTSFESDSLARYLIAAVAVVVGFRRFVASPVPPAASSSAT